MSDAKMSDSKQAPGLPTVTDEAGDSPGWLPALGLALLCVVAVLIAARQAVAPQAPANDPATAGDAGVQAAAGEKPAEVKPQAAKPEPVAVPVRARPAGQPIEIRPVEPGGAPIQVQRVGAGSEPIKLERVKPGEARPGQVQPAEARPAAGH